MTVTEFNPLTDSRWPAFLLRHPDSSIFHGRPWLNALRVSYGYKPVAFTTSGSGELTNALLCCEVASPLTGKRLVSLPFSDHCEPLVRGEELTAVLDYLSAQLSNRRWQYVELRPLRSLPPSGFISSAAFHLHTIDLRPPLAEVYERFHGSCIRRKIKKAERESLLYQAGRSNELLRQFRTLLLLTRRRHRIPPQPKHWFRNLLRCLGNDVTIHLMSKEGRPIASILTLQHKRVLTYKYGCSDSAFSNLGGTPLLFWKAIQQAKAQGVDTFDLGRSDREDSGLSDFKQHLGAVGSDLVYLRNSGRRPIPGVEAHTSAAAKLLAQKVLVRLPDPIFSGVGTLLYRHLG